MGTMSKNTEKQIHDMCSPANYCRPYYKKRAIDFSKLPRNERLRRFSAEISAIALAEAFGIENAVLLPSSVTRR